MVASRGRSVRRDGGHRRGVGRRLWDQLDILVRPNPRNPVGDSRKGRHKCPVPACSRFVRDEYLMCPSHWTLVSRPVQREVYATKDMHPGEPKRRDIIARAIADVVGHSTEGTK